MISGVAALGKHGGDRRSNGRDHSAVILGRLYDGGGLRLLGRGLGSLFLAFSALCLTGEEAFHDHKDAHDDCKNYKNHDHTHNDHDTGFGKSFAQSHTVGRQKHRQIHHIIHIRTSELKRKVDMTAGGLTLGL